MTESQLFRTHKYMQLHADRRMLPIRSGVARFFGARTEYTQWPSLKEIMTFKKITMIY